MTPLSSNWGSHRAGLRRLLEELWGAAAYLGLLLREMFKANLRVMGLILARDIELEPCLARFRTHLKTEAARVALANSITLTPGTVAVSLEGDELLVHALNRDMARRLVDSALERALRNLENMSINAKEGSHA